MYGKCKKHSTMAAYAISLCLCHYLVQSYVLSLPYSVQIHGHIYKRMVKNIFVSDKLYCKDKMCVTIIALQRILWPFTCNRGCVKHVCIMLAKYKNSKHLSLIYGLAKTSNLAVVYISTYITFVVLRFMLAAYYKKF